MCRGGKPDALGAWVCPEDEFHCLIAPSAEAEMTLSLIVHDKSQTASECAIVGGEL